MESERTSPDWWQSEFWQPLFRLAYAHWKLVLLGTILLAIYAFLNYQRPTDINPPFTVRPPPGGMPVHQ